MLHGVLLTSHRDHEENIHVYTVYIQQQDIQQVFIIEFFSNSNV